MRSIDKTNSRTFGRRAFTLAELLIVVAIIAVLVGISIPIFNAQLEKSRETVDIATMRQAKSAAVELYYAGIHDQTSAKAYGFGWWAGSGSDPVNAYAVYDPETGGFYDPGSKYSKAKAYGQGTATDGGTSYSGYNNTLDYTKAVVQVAIYPNGAGNALNGTKYASQKNIYGNVPCIVIEWHNVNSTSFVGRVGTNKKSAQVVFLS